MKLAKNLMRISSLKKPLSSTIQPSHHVDEDAYLTAIPYEPKKGLSREFLAYFATFLRDTAELALDELMDFLADEEAESFEIVWNQEVFEEGKVGLEESAFYPYPRY